jgi:alkylresorcinol/alkylpyrone synthase
VKLVSVATAVPPYILEQRDVAAAAHRGLCPALHRFRAPCAGVQDFRNSSTLCRLPWNGIFEPLGWPERSSAYRDGACQLFVDAANKPLDAAGISAADVDTVVTISSTGIATPSLEARAATPVGFRTDVERVPVFGLGCAGGVSGFSIASRLAQSRPCTAK